MNQLFFAVDYARPFEWIEPVWQSETEELKKKHNMPQTNETADTHVSV